MRRLLLGGLILAMMLAVLGCIDYAETLELNADGTGTMTTRMVMHKKYFEELASLGQMSDSANAADMFTFVKREDIEKKVKSSKGKVKLLDFKETTTDSTVAYDMKFSFTDLQEMLEVSGNMGDGEEMAAPAVKREVRFAKQASGNWLFTRDFADSAAAQMMQSPEPTESSATAEATEAEETTESVEGNEEPDSAAGEYESMEVMDSLGQAMGDAVTDMSDMMTTMMESAFAGRKIILTVKFPGQIVETNAKRTEGNAAIWEYSFVELMKAPPQLRALVRP